MSKFTESINNTPAQQVTLKPRKLEPIVNQENKASIFRKIIIDAEIVTKSPLRIGSGDNDDITDIMILRDKKGRFFIPGTSLAGVLRAEIVSVYGERVAEKLFGSIDDDGNQSMLIVNDVILNNANLTYRDGVSIDPLTGTAIRGAKYDYEALERGASGRINLELTIRYHSMKNTVDFDGYVHDDFKAVDDFYGELAAALADLLTVGIRVGSLTSKGFGKIASKNPACCYEYCFDNKEDAAKWYKYISEEKQIGNIIYLGTKIKKLVGYSDFSVQLNCALKSSLLIADYNVDEKEIAANKENDEDECTISAVQMKNGDSYVIPGTSIKGVLRSTAVKLLLALNKGNLEKANAFVEELMGYARQNTKESKKSRLVVDEIYIKNSVLTPRKHSRNRIDRFTGGTINGALYTVEPIWQQDKNKSTVQFDFYVHNCSEAEAGLILLLIKELWYGNMAIGSDKSIGRGVFKGIIGKINYKGNTIYVEDDHGYIVVAENGNLLEGYVKALVGEING